MWSKLGEFLEIVYEKFPSNIVNEIGKP